MKTQTAPHTPGPWVIDSELPPNARSVIARTTGNHTPISAPITVDGLICGGRIMDDANARLIAAAPDLLAALIAVSNGFADGSIQWARQRQADSDPYHKANSLMCAAIDRATKGDPA